MAEENKLHTKFFQGNSGERLENAVNSFLRHNNVEFIAGNYSVLPVEQQRYRGRGKVYTYFLTYRQGQEKPGKEAASSGK